MENAVYIYIQQDARFKGVANIANYMAIESYKLLSNYFILCLLNYIAIFYGYAHPWIIRYNHVCNKKKTFYLNVGFFYLILKF